LLGDLYNKSPWRYHENAWNFYITCNIEILTPPGPWLCFSKNTGKLPHIDKKRAKEKKPFFRTSTVGFGLSLVWEYVEKNSEFLIV
jgi:hypothetical protein